MPVRTWSGMAACAGDTITAPQDATIGAATSPQPSLIIVDDEEHVIALLSAILEDYSLHAFETGDEVIAAVEDGLRADGALVDVMMPGMDGFALTAWLRAYAPTAELPVLMLTALGEEVQRDRASAAGADAFLAKPFDTAELRRVVAELVPNPASG